MIVVTFDPPRETDAGLVVEERIEWTDPDGAEVSDTHGASDVRITWIGRSGSVVWTGWGSAGAEPLTFGT